MNKRLVGSRHEEQAASFLRERGLEILTSNFRCRIGEIDLIAREENTLVFVEVKYRFSDRYGWGEEHVHKKKQATIFKVAEVYISRFCKESIPPCRFDVVAIDGEKIVYYRNAFGRGF